LIKNNYSSDLSFRPTDNSRHIKNPKKDIVARIDVTQISQASTPAFVSYQEELKQIWSDNVAATKSKVLEDKDYSFIYTGSLQYIKKRVIFI
jgi:hypothetical protein